MNQHITARVYRSDGVTIGTFHWMEDGTLNVFAHSTDIVNDLEKEPRHISCFFDPLDSLYVRTY